MKYRSCPLLIFLFIAQILYTQNITVNKGSGVFKINGSGSHGTDSITIFYHKPENFTRGSRVLIVVPGAGRNADDYRDSWVEASEKHRILIISPSYPEKEYNYGEYHLGGIVKDLDLSKGVSFRRGTNQVYLDEDVMKFHFDANKGSWIFNDFDRIFKLVKKATKLKQRKYDIFGHSAGGQILHRFALFYPKSKADKILASNAGSYTVPDYKTNFPFGIKNVGINQKRLNKSFRKKLILFLGELDNDSETRGRILRSNTADQQGSNRLERGKNFYTFSRELASNLGLRFDWKLEVIPNVGHDQERIAKAASAYLYGQE